MNTNRIIKLKAMCEDIKDALAKLKQKNKHQETQEVASDNIEVVFSAEKSSKKGKFIANLYRASLSYDSFAESVNSYCAETLRDYLTTRDLPTDEELKQMLKELEIPYKMYRRINDYLKNNS